MNKRNFSFVRLLFPSVLQAHNADKNNCRLNNYSINRSDMYLPNVA